MLRLFFICSAVLLTGILAQNMTQTAVKRYFKYTDANGLKNITTKLNSAKDGPLCKQKCTNLANSKQFIGSGVAVNSSDPFSKPAKVIPACQKFCAHRFAFRKFVNFLKDRLVNKQFSTTVAAKVKTLFFTEDKDTNNYFMITMNQAMPKLMTIAPPAKMDLFMKTIGDGMQAFFDKFPTAALNLFEYVEPGPMPTPGGSSVVVTVPRT